MSVEVLDMSQLETQKSVPARRCGAIRQPDGTVRFRVWAPNAKAVTLRLDDHTPSDCVLSPEGDGHFAVTLPDIDDGQRYGFRLDDSTNTRPDPCSLFQPDGVSGLSAVVSTDQFDWTDDHWRGIRRDQLVVYELHIGTFTKAGTFEAAIDRLDDLKELGVNAIEIMPVAQFPGGRNWGYDGVLPYAAQNTYGGPHGLAKLVDAAHVRGIAVILDVVYNHFGPEHAYHREFGPYFTDKYKTPWGDAINYDDRGSDNVRDYVLDNARMWLEEFHLDGLRLDAVHAIYDLGASHILRAIQRVADRVAAAKSREIIIIAESDLNDPRLLHSEDRGGFNLGAQWSDDFHHAVHALLTGERRGYYADYGETENLVGVLNSPFLIAGTYSAGRGRKHGAPPDGLAGDRFVVCIQNHDQVGNRAVGDRLSTIVDAPARRRLAACLLLLSPHIPMLFMGEEYGESNPFPFFCSFEGHELAEAVRNGRKREFADFVDDPAVIPDPLAAATFQSAKLSWDWHEADRKGLRALYADLIKARRDTTALRDFEHRSARVVQENVIELMRGEGAESITILINLNESPVTMQPHASRTKKMFSSESKRYDGAGSNAEVLAPFEAAAYGALVVGAGGQL